MEFLCVVVEVFLGDGAIVCVKVIVQVDECEFGVAIFVVVEDVIKGRLDCFHDELDECVVCGFVDIHFLTFELVFHY